MGSWTKTLWQAYDKDFTEKRFKPLFKPLEEIRINDLKVRVARDLCEKLGINFAPFSDLDAIPLDRVLLIAHQKVDERFPTDEAAAAFLREATKKYGFGFQPGYDQPRDLIHQFVDVQVNRCVTAEVLKVYREDLSATTALTKPKLNKALLDDFKTHLNGGKEDRLAKLYASKIEDGLKQVQGGDARPIYFISIGGGKGVLDQKMVAALRTRHSNQKIFVINFEPYTPASEFVFSKEDGMVVHDVSLDDHAAIAKRVEEIIKERGDQSPIRIVGCSRALHHTHQSIGNFVHLAKEQMHADSALLVEHPIADIYRQQLPYKIMRIADEVVANFALFGNSSWFQSEDTFKMQFFRGEELERQLPETSRVTAGTRIYMGMLQGRAAQANEAARGAAV